MKNNPSHKILLITSWIVIISTSLLANDFNSSINHSKSGLIIDSKSPKSQYIRKEPYMISNLVPDEMQILWQLYQSNTCTLEWGTDVSYSLGNVSTSEYGNDHQHSYTISGLEPETIYYFRLTVLSDVITGRFKSLPPDSNQSLTFIAYGDTRSHPNHHNDVAEQILNILDNNNEALSFIAFTGDFVKDGSNEGDWDTQFFSDNYPFIRQLMTEEPYMACVGNHEGNGLLFAKYFPYPFYANGDYYFSFDYGPAHFTIIDQFSPYTPGSVQYQWIENDLATTNKLWKFILLHEPGWSAGGGHENNTTVQNFIQPLCEQYGVQFVIGGHNHYYACAVVGSVVHITTGGGGAPQYNPNPNYPNIVHVAKEYHFCELEINQNTLHFTAINDDGDVIHEFNYADLVPPTTLNNASCVQAMNIPLTNCTGELTPEAVIKNNGGNILSSVDINYRVNNGTINTYNWSGSLLLNQSETVELPTISFPLNDENNLQIYTTNPNGQPDEDPTFDTTNTSFAQAELAIPNIYLFLKLDNHPEETTWELKNSSGTVLDSGGPYAQPQAFIKDTLEISSNDCYTFTLFDDGGDGLSDGGYYALRDHTFSLIYEDDDFSLDKESVQFSIEQLGINPRHNKDNLTMLINPYSGSPQVIFDIEKPSNIELSIYNLLGDEVFHQSDQALKAGHHVIEINSVNFSSGVYLIRLKKDRELISIKRALYK